MINLNHSQLINIITRSLTSQNYLQQQLKEDLLLVFEDFRLENLKSPIQRSIIRQTPQYIIQPDGSKQRGKYLEMIDSSLRKETNMNLAFLKFVNNSIKMVADKFKVKGRYSSHSFRIGRINRLLKEFPLEKVCQMIGHQCVQTTYLYSRMFEDEEYKEKLELVDKVEETF